jgi:hypothetical protein
MQQVSKTAVRGAIRRGLRFISDMAGDPAIFVEHGSDLMSCFFFISSTSKDQWLRGEALGVGRELARGWRRDYQELPRQLSPGLITDYLYGSLAAEQLGYPSRRMRDQIRAASSRYTAEDYLGFDPIKEGPPLDIPQDCECGSAGERGRKSCPSCGRRLGYKSRYAVWYEALIIAYNAQRYGIWLGASYADVLAWLPRLRPYLGYDDGSNPDFEDTAYAITHIVYTLNDYSAYLLPPGLLEQELAFLKRNLKAVIATDDPELAGEFLDSLRAFGQAGTPLVNLGMRYLLDRQNEDGSWGDYDEDRHYGRYHSTWTAIDGLREYAWQGRKVSFQSAEAMLRGWK